MAEKKDKFANKFYGNVVESAANTLTFAEIQTGTEIFSKRAWVLSRLEYRLTSAMALLLTGADVLSIALTSSNKMEALSLGDAGVIDLMELSIRFFSASGFNVVQQPFIRDFSSLPSGGLIITPRPLYLAVLGTDLASAATISVRGYFTQMTLKADEYLELVDFYRIVQ